MTDYGLAPINIRFIGNESTTENVRGFAPEIIKPAPGSPVTAYESKPADIFAFAMLANEILSGRKPFEGHGGPKIVDMIFRGERPGFPQNAADAHLTIEMQEFIQRCWDSDPKKRPKIDEVVRTCEGLVRNNEYM